MTAHYVLAVILAAGLATPAAAMVDITTIPAKTFAEFSQLGVARGAVPKLAYYLNEDVTKTTGVTVKTPHVTTTLVTTTTTVNVTSHVTTYVPVINAATGKQLVIKGVPQTTKVVTTIVTPTQVTTTKPVTTTTYTSVTTYSTHTTPKAELMTTIGSGQALASPVVSFLYSTTFGSAAREALLGTQQAARLTLDAVSTSAPVFFSGNYFTQLFDHGTISFARTTPVYGRNHAGPVPHTNLLTVSFTNAMLFGQLGGSTFALTASTPSSVITYTSDFLNFNNDFNNDFSLSFNAVSPGLKVATTTPTAINQTNVTGAHTLVSARATLSGQFGASSVPEPAVWTTMIAGFALIGLRRRRRGMTTLAA